MLAALADLDGSAIVGGSFRLFLFSVLGDHEEHPSSSGPCLSGGGGDGLSSVLASDAVLLDDRTVLCGRASLVIDYISIYLSQTGDNEKPLFWAGAWLAFGMFLRPQIILVVPIFLVAIALRTFSDLPKNRRIVFLSSIGALIVLPLTVSIPLRWLNHRQYDSWSLNIFDGDMMGLYLNSEPAFNPAHGKASRTALIGPRNL